jgi:hypothetical protein
MRYLFGRVIITTRAETRQPFFGDPPGRKDNFQCMRKIFQKFSPRVGTPTRRRAVDIRARTVVSAE